MPVEARRGSDALLLELQAVLSYLMQMWRIELGPLEEH